MTKYQNPYNYPCVLMGYGDVKANEIIELNDVQAKYAQEANFKQVVEPPVTKPEPAKPPENKPTGGK